MLRFHHRPITLPTPWHPGVPFDAISRTETRKNFRVPIWKGVVKGVRIAMSPQVTAAVSRHQGREGGHTHTQEPRLFICLFIHSYLGDWLCGRMRFVFPLFIFAFIICMGVMISGFIDLFIYLFLYSSILCLSNEFLFCREMQKMNGMCFIWIFFIPFWGSGIFLHIDNELECWNIICPFLFIRVGYFCIWKKWNVFYLFRYCHLLVFGNFYEWVLYVTC